MFMLPLFDYVASVMQLENKLAYACKTQVLYLGGETQVLNQVGETQALNLADEA